MFTVVNINHGAPSAELLALSFDLYSSGDNSHPVNHHYLRPVSKGRDASSAPCQVPPLIGRGLVKYLLTLLFVLMVFK